MTDIERLIDQFLAYIDVERGLAKATVRAYDSDLRKYNGWLATQGFQDLNAVTTQDVERYIAFLDDSGESARSKARRLASIHAFHRFALNEHVVSNDVAAQIKAPKGATTRAHWGRGGQFAGRDPRLAESASIRRHGGHAR